MLGGLLVLAILIIIILVIVMRRRKKKPPTDTHPPVIYSNRGIDTMDNPVYMGKKTFDGESFMTNSSDLHFNPHADANIYERVADDYATVNGEGEFVVSSNANSREDLLYSPLYK